jgi:cytochrome b561/polyisoprenoid-binding protein YceI
MLNKTTPTRYSSVAIWLHWLLAAGLSGQIALGFAMPRDASGFALYQLHKSIGIVILVLSLARLAWRFAKPRPAPLERGFNGFLAGAVHWGFYAFMILGPLTGWALVSNAPINVPTLLFGVVPVPHLPIGGDHEMWEEAHELLAFVGMGLFLLHVLGALRHHFLIRDGLLARMAPAGMPGLALLLGAAVIGIHALVLAMAGGEEQAKGEGAPVESSAPVAAPVAEPLAEASDAAEAEEPEAEETAAAADESADAATPAWTIRPGGSLRFAVDNAGYALEGSFSRWTGDIAFDPENPASAAITIRVQLASASMGDATQDAMLQGENFFASAANPVATWRSTRVTSTGAGQYRAEGTLSLRGASRPQPLTFTLSGTGNRRSVRGNAVIDRNAFGVGTGPDAAGVAGSVNLSFAFDAAS